MATPSGVWCIRKRSSLQVLLAAGAVSSPQVLMLSGVGPAEHLESKVSNLQLCGESSDLHTGQQDLESPL